MISKLLCKVQTSYYNLDGNQKLPDFRFIAKEGQRLMALTYIFSVFFIFVHSRDVHNAFFSIYITTSMIVDFFLTFTAISYYYCC